MLLYSIIIFAIAAVGGVVLASKVLAGKFAPWALSVAGFLTLLTVLLGI